MNKSFILPIVISIILHSISFNIGDSVFQIFMKYKGPKVRNNSIPIEIQKISKRELQDIRKLRTIGVKNGKKEFSIPIVKKKVKNNFKKLSLDKYKYIEAKSSKNKKPQKSNPLKSKELNGSFYKYSGFRPKKRSIDNQFKNLKNNSFTPEDSLLLKHSNIDIIFEPPEGISEDELNSFEKIYYSFQKRSFEKYVSSYIKSFNEILLKKPYAKQLILGDRHKLTGKVTFDKDGNIISVKILKWSNNDDVQKLFEKTLTGINKLSNPPKNITQKGKFSLYYSLTINI